MDTADIWTILIAAVAFIFSIISLIITTSTSKKMSEKQLHATLFESLFFDTIKEHLPAALMSLNYSQGKLSANYQIVCDHIYVMIEKARFYRYFDTEFYKKFLTQLYKLDEIIIVSSGKSGVPKEVIENDIKKIHDQASIVYSTMRDMYSKS